MTIRLSVELDDWVRTHARESKTSQTLIIEDAVRKLRAANDEAVEVAHRAIVGSR